MYLYSIFHFGRGGFWGSGLGCLLERVGTLVLSGWVFLGGFLLVLLSSVSTMFIDISHTEYGLTLRPPYVLGDSAREYDFYEHMNDSYNT